MEIVTIHDYWSLILKSQDTPYVGIIVKIPPRFWREIESVQSELRSVDQRQIYSYPSTLRITVKGIGVLDEEKLDWSKLESIFARIKNVVSEFRPFEISLRGLGIFPTSIHVKVLDPTNQLQMMNKRLSEELAGQVDTSAYDGETYIPHVTIASFNTKDVDDLIERVNSRELKDRDFGSTMVFEAEADEVKMFMAFREGEAQQRAFGYIRSFHLG